MIYDVSTFDEILTLPIRPQTQFYLEANVYNIGGHVVASNVQGGDITLNNTQLVPNPNNLRGATLCENGYCVDDPNLRIMNYTNYYNLMFVSAVFTAVSQAKQLLYKIQHPYEDTFTIAITIGPLYKGSFRFDWIEYDIDDDSIISTQTITLTATSDYEDLEFDTNPTTTSTAYKLMATALDADAVDCRICFDIPVVSGASRYIIDNSNLINFHSDERADLYSQSRSSFEYTVEFLDVAHQFDPQNPTGEYSGLVVGSLYTIYMGYNINGMFVDARSAGWKRYRKYSYLKDLPTWENEKVTLHLADDHTFNSNLTTQVPYISTSDGVTLKKFAPNTSDYGKQVLTDMNYYIRYKVGPYRFGSPVNMTIDDNTKALMETSGYLYNDRLIEDVYTLAQNALGCWNYGKNISDISVADAIDYTIDNSVIYDQGMSFNKEPLLKTLTIKKYTNVKSATQIKYTVTLQASDFELVGTGARPYRAYIKTENPLTNLVNAYVSSYNTHDWVYTRTYKRDFVSGLCYWEICVYAPTPAEGAATYTLNVYPIETTTEDVSEVVNQEGENLTIDNPFITSNALLTLCATAAKRIAAWREVYELDVMENFGLKIGDIVKLDTLYETGIPVIITGLQFNIPGPKGHITCRRIS